MKKQFGLLALIGVLFFSSCIYSLHPLYTKDTQVFEASLIGTWEKDEQSFIFKKVGKKDYYKLTHVDRKEDTVTDSEAHLVKLGNHYYLDFQRWTDYGDLFDFNVLAPRMDVHNFARVVWNNDQLELIFFDGDKIGKLLEQRRARIDYEKVGMEEFVLTAQPEELQEFVTKYGDELLDFSETLVLPKVLN
ncbi:hypothetical protein [Flavilitoribacter nigricans]|uniref:Lipoprotein n=1 Tax=Flavilitoribacter nigricans (strain ATCC 23147 / DSM 23189 / NBRC 102662 / NCIMB 1420 / SS-2) TaxID=1122177 RepID=A0A2D0MYG8_FLAN2|nr:hypothetical protein [Flavilitoribacter nigricans]PHN01321.1 hypothetical protein CRP01_37820 [Flavilitoribacter nigricans DSM 23189 = NBRC 102662]